MNKKYEQSIQVVWYHILTFVGAICMKDKETVEHLHQNSLNPQVGSEKTRECIERANNETIQTEVYRMTATQPNLK